MSTFYLNTIFVIVASSIFGWWLLQYYKRLVFIPHGRQIKETISDYLVMCDTILDAPIIHIITSIIQWISV